MLPTTHYYDIPIATENENISSSMYDIGKGYVRLTLYIL